MIGHLYILWISMWLLHSFILYFRGIRLWSYNSSRSGGIFVSEKWVVIVSGNGLSPASFPAINWNDVDLWWIGPLGRNCNEIWNTMPQFPINEMYLKTVQPHWDKNHSDYFRNPVVVLWNFLTGWNNDDVIKWKHFLPYWPFVRWIHWSLVDSPHKGQWHRTLMFSLICAWTNGLANNGDAGNLRHHDITVMIFIVLRHQSSMLDDISSSYEDPGACCWLHWSCLYQWNGKLVMFSALSTLKALSLSKQ